MEVEYVALLASSLPVCYVTSANLATPPSIIPYDLLAVQQLVRSEEFPQAVRIPQFRADVTPAQEQFQSRPSHIHKGGVEPSPPLFISTFSSRRSHGAPSLVASLERVRHRDVGHHVLRTTGQGAL